ncbi:MAG: tetratricopeptide repeat protein [Flavobacteriales bacterium]|nr:tetratricopeptide repeat protein [Flavobacteriales bacterium]
MLIRPLYLNFLIFFLLSGFAYGQEFNHVMTSPAGAPNPTRKLNGFTFDQDKNLYLCDATAKVINVYDAAGQSISTLGAVKTSSGEVKFVNPTQLAIDANGTLYIYDEGLGKILKKPVEGPAVVFGQKGSGLGQINDVLALAADSRGYCYVLNGSAKRIDVYNPDGSYLTWISGTNIPFDDPIAIGVNGANELYVLEKQGTTVFMFDASGKLVNTNRSLSSRKEVSITKPISMAVLPNGDFLILDAITGKSTMFNRIGVVMGTVGSKGNVGPGVFGEPVSIVGQSSSLFIGVMDKTTQQVQILQVKSPSKLNSSDPKRYRLQPVKSSLPSLRALAAAPNGLRYAILSKDRTKVVAYRDTTSQDVFSVVGKLKDAVDIACDSASNFYVVDRDVDEVLMFDDKGTFIRKFGKEIQDKLKDPVAVAIQKSGNIIVADQSRGSLYMWSSQGVFKKIITSPENSVIRSPKKIQVDSKDQIYVWDEEANCIYRTGSGGWPTAEKKIYARAERPGEKAGEIGDFFVDPLDMVHVFNKTTSQIEVYAWDFEPEMKYSAGSPVAGTFGFASTGTVSIDRLNLRVFLTGEKGEFQHSYQFLVPPPVPEGKVTYDVIDGNLQMYFSKLKSPAVVAYGLLEKAEDGEKVSMKTSSSSFALSDQKDDVLHHYGFVSMSWSDFSEPAFWFDDYFTYGKKMLSNGRYNEALGAWQLALEKCGRPTRMAEYIAIHLSDEAMKMIGKKEVAEAKRYVEYAFQLLPSDKKVLSQYGKVHKVYYEYLLGLGESAAMLDDIKKQIEQPALKSLILHTADSVSSIHSLEESLASINTAISIKKKLIEWDNNSEYHATLSMAYAELYEYKRVRDVTAPEIESILREIIKYGQSGYTGLKQAKFNYFDVHLTLLNALNATGKYDDVQKQAGTELGSASQAMSKNIQKSYRNILAESYASQKKYDLAEAEYKTLISLDPSDRNTQSSFADMLAEAGKYEVAKGMLQQLLVNADQPAGFISRIGKIELLNGRYAEASFQLEKAIEADPSVSMNYGYLAEAYDLAGNTDKAQDNYEVAINYLEKTLNNVNRNNLTLLDMNTLRSKRAQYILAAGRIATEQGEKELAGQYFEKLTLINPNSATAWHGLGNIYLETGRVYDAIDAFDKALNLEPDNKTYSASFTHAIQLREDALKSQTPLAIINIQVKDIYPALYKNYADARQLPLGEMTLANNTPDMIVPASVTVMIADYMSQPTPVNAQGISGYSNDKLKISAILPEKVLDNAEKKSLTAEVVITYVRNGVTETIRKSAVFNLHGRNAITWSDKRLLASFVSPQDQQVIAFTKEVDAFYRTSPSYGMNKVMLKAMQLYTVLEDAGISYSADPNQSYSKVSMHEDQLDFLQYPAETFQRKGGDCDDLVALMSSMLENSGVPSAYIDIPGHVMVAFDCGIKSADLKVSGLDNTDVIVIGDHVWIPVETTLLGSRNFMLAWKSGAERFYEELHAGHFPELIPMAEAWKFYQPSSYSPSNFAMKLSAGKKATDTYDALVNQLVAKTRNQAVVEMRNRYNTEPGNTYIMNHYAMLMAQTGNLREAERVFLEALQINSEDASVLNNLGNIAYLDGNYTSAISFYEQAHGFDPEDADILINLCRANLATGNKTAAADWYNKAVTLNAETGDIYIHLKTQLK